MFSGRVLYVSTDMLSNIKKKKMKRSQVKRKKKRKRKKKNKKKRKKKLEGCVFSLSVQDGGHRR